MTGTENGARSYLTEASEMSVTDHAIAQITQMISGRQIGPGDRLPTENELCSQFGLSRSSLREAIRALAHIGVLEVRQGDGTYVSKLDPYRLLNTMSFMADVVQSNTLLELFHVRRLLEPAATALATARMNESKLLDLKKALRRIGSASNVPELAAADQEFHNIIAKTAGNATLSALLESLFSHTLRARVWRALTEEGLLIAKDKHEVIYQAVLAKDPELARAAATMHIYEVELWLRERLEPNVRPDGRTDEVSVPLI